MCGINGIVSKKELSNLYDIASIRKMNSKIIHRGPDSEGLYEDAVHDYKLFMGMRRLSIIDLNTGDQPIFNTDKSIVLIFNGEVYNFLELKRKYFKDNTIFYTKTDTEVVLKLYEKFGENSFSLLDGAFAFSIYDKSKQKIFIVRDFFGEKPLYYTSSSGSFIWASELKSIISILPQMPVISIEGLNLFFQLTYIPPPFTIYKNIYKLENNCFIEFNCVKNSYLIQTIAHKFEEIDKDITFNEAKQKTFYMVQKSVENRSISDVPIGTFLSGGVDSSIVSWSLANQSKTKIDTFSIGFEKKIFDESHKAKLVAKIINSNHHEFIISELDLSNKITEILLNFDEPFADSSALPTYLVASHSKEHVTVALTGDGGDEVFGGYNKYYVAKLNRNYQRIIPEHIHKKVMNFYSHLLNVKNDDRGIRFKLKKLLRSIDYTNDFYSNIVSLGFQKNELLALFKKEYLIHNDLLEYFKFKIEFNKSNLNNFREFDKLVSLDGDMLVKVDRTSMLVSLECRAPFLNKELWNFTKHLPENYLIKRWDKKYLLRETFKEYFPKKFLSKPKQGFGVPVGDWLSKGLKHELLSYIDMDFIKKQNIFDFQTVSKLVNDHVEHKVDNSFKVWTYYCFQKWYTHLYAIQ
ncbi:MAG: asparagine synthase (glutamine-hydrolyzing) [Ignavibacteriae bacterium]|nr:asparagine synthase (glutamine-hydrolyzing) [Ignavibacteriota bacterium]